MSDAGLTQARRLLAHEAAADPDARTPVPVRTWDKLLAQVSPLIGVAGAEMLFVRSARMQRSGTLGTVSLLDGAPQVRAALQAIDPAAPPDVMALWLATYLALLATFIGERLTAQVLQRAFPTFDLLNPEETP